MCIHLKVENLERPWPYFPSPLYSAFFLYYVPLNGSAEKVESESCFP